MQAGLIQCIRFLLYSIGQSYWTFVKHEIFTYNKIESHIAYNEEACYTEKVFKTSFNLIIQKFLFLTNMG